MGFLPQQRGELARCDGCWRLEQVLCSYPPEWGRGEFCRVLGWVRDSGGALFCSECWKARLLDFPAWAVPGRRIELIEKWCDHPVGTVAEVVSTSESRGAVGESRRIIHIRPPPESERRWQGNLWLDRDCHLKWKPVQYRSRWEVIGGPE